MLRLCVSLALLSMGTSMEQDVRVAGQKCDGAAQLDDGMNLIQQLSTKSMDASDAKTQRVMAGIKASALESQIREWAVKAAAGEHVPDDIIKLVEAVLANLEKIKEGTQKEHSTDVDLLKKLTTRMGECGSSASKAQTDADGINDLARNSEANRQTHAQCRADEGKALDSKTTACDAFELFSSRLKTDSPKLECAADLAEKDEANMLKCMEALEDWTSSYSTTDYRAKKNDCEAKTATHTNKKKTCDDAQDTFELGFCRHEALLTATCSEQTSCRETMGAEKDEVCGAVQSNANVRKTEYSSIERAKCYVEVLKIDGKADAKTAKVNECDKMEINVSGLEVTCPEMQAATACDVTVVADKPGDVDFLTKEYTDQDWHGKAPTETCTPCPDTKLAECPAEDATTVNFNGYNYRTISGKAKTDTNAGCENSWTSMPVGYEFATYSDDIQKNVVSKYRWGFHIMMYGDTWTPERQEVYPTGIDPSGVKQVHSGYGMLHDVATDRYKVSACSWGILVQKKCKPQATKAINKESTVVAPPSSCLLWFDGKDGVVADSGGRVSQWRDKCGGGRDLKQYTSGPLYHEAEGGVEWDGYRILRTEYLASGLMTTPAHLIMKIKLGDAEHARWGYLLDGRALDTMSLGQYQGQMRPYQKGGHPSSKPEGIDYTPDKEQIVEVVFNGAASKVAIDGADFVGDFAASASNQDPRGLTIGDDGGLRGGNAPSKPYTIYDLKIFKGELSAEQRASMIANLRVG